MKGVFAVLLVGSAAALGCHGRSSPAQRNQPQYDVVQEGQSGTATSTISAPGEVQPPTTATNTDTTGTFALGTALPPANMPGGPAGGVMTPQQPGSMASGMPTSAPVQPRPAGTVYVPPPPQQPVPMTPTVVTTTPQPPPRRERKPPTQTDTTATTTSSDTAPTTDTATTDTTSTEKKNKDKEKTDTSQPPPSPPPPTSTDTIGGH